MGLMFRRRRPIARMAAGAATAGVAYHMGKSHEQQAQYNEQAQAAYSATQQPQYQQPQYAPPPQQYAAAPPAAGGTGDLDRLVELHNSGALDDQEFAAAKAKLLGI